MKQGKFKILSLSLVIFFLIPLNLSADLSTENLVSRELETFDDYGEKETEWLVRGSKFVSEGYPLQAIVEDAPYALAGDNVEGMKVLGAQAAFDRKGYNYLEFIPVKDDGSGNLVPDPIDIPGRVKFIDMWVWGSKYNYYMELHISDYNGVVYKLRLGDIDYAGWQNLRVQLPTYIPQSAEHIPYYKGLSLEKVVLWTTPDEDVSEFVVFIDHIKVLTDVFETRFDGDQLADPQTVESLNWEKRSN